MQVEQRLENRQDRNRSIFQARDNKAESRATRLYDTEVLAPWEYHVFPDGRGPATALRRLSVLMHGRASRLVIGAARYQTGKEKAAGWLLFRSSRYWRMNQASFSLMRAALPDRSRR